jgi:hypothetical protein
MKNQDIHRRRNLMDEQASPILRDAFERFAAACRANPTDRDYFTFGEPQFDRLVREVAFTLPTYESVPSGWEGRPLKHVRIIRAWRALQEFLGRTKAFVSIHSGQFNSTQAAAAFEGEVAREFCEMKQSFVLDGLELASPTLSFRRGRFVKLTETTFREIAGEDAESHDHRLGLYVLELRWRSPNPPWNTGLFEDAQSTQMRVQRLAYPWIVFINLWARGKVRIGGVWESTDSGLCSQRRYLEIDEPIWEDHYEHDDQRDVDEWESESPRRTVTVSNETGFVTFLERLDDGLQRMGPEAHRADIAMRYFRRVVENFWAHNIGDRGPSQDDNEDIIVDATTGLEALLLADEKRGKGALMAARAAAIIEGADHNRRVVRKRIERLYKVRSAILHGDVRPPANELTEVAVDAEEFSRRCLAAFLLADGDREGFLRASTDTVIAERLRLKIMQ